MSTKEEYKEKLEKVVDQVIDVLENNNITIVECLGVLDAVQKGFENFIKKLEDSNGNKQ